MTGKYASYLLYLCKNAKPIDVLQFNDPSFLQGIVVRFLKDSQFSKFESWAWALVCPWGNQAGADTTQITDLVGFGKRMIMEKIDGQNIWNANP